MFCNYISNDFMFVTQYQFRLRAMKLSVVATDFLHECWGSVVMNLAFLMQKIMYCHCLVNNMPLICLPLRKI